MGFMTKLSSLFCKKIRAYNEGFLPEKDGHKIYYQQVGNPDGEVMLFFHGGPGGSSKAEHGSCYNLRKYRLIMFDQRACGKSLYQDAFYKNTLQETIKDAKRLLEHLNIKGKVIIQGISYGATCGLLFAETYPELVKKIVLISVYMGGPFIDEAAHVFYPDNIDIINSHAKGEDVESFYHKLIFSNKLNDQKKALKYYGAFERQVGDLDIKFDEPEVTDIKVHKFRITMHYVINKMFLKENQLIKDTKKIAHIPTVIYQNRLDMNCLPRDAYSLHKALPKSKLYIVPSAGHISEMLFDRITMDFKKKED